MGILGLLLRQVVLHGPESQMRNLKSMYNMYISWFVNFASSNVAISSCSCLEVLLSVRNPS